MAFRQSKHIFKGMNKDLAKDKQSPEYYIDAKNIRLTVREDGEMMAVVNEKGPKKFTTKNIEYNLDYFKSSDPRDSTSSGSINVSSMLYVGHAVINECVVLFTISTFTLTGSRKEDSYRDVPVIWKVYKNNNNLVFHILYVDTNKTLKFNVNNPIETLVDYESEDVQKVYWTDGVNQPRVINIVEENLASKSSSYFDFVPEVYQDGIDTLSVIVEKYYGTEGLFKSGTIQYFATYYNKFKQESNVVWQSNLLYISPINRGGTVDETCSNSFKLTFKFKNSIRPNDFDYLRIYSVQHTSQDTDLIAKIVTDLPLSNLETIKEFGGDLNNSTTSVLGVIYVDNGTTGENINPTDLYYKGGIPVAIGTMTAKDKTLFLGNIKLKNNQAINEDLKVQLREQFSNAEFNLRPVTFSETDTVTVSEGTTMIYRYNNQLQSTKCITGLKFQEEYRFGLQLQDTYGVWSEPIWLGDKTNIKYPSINPDNDNQIQIPCLTLSLDTTNLKKSNYKKVRPLIVFPEENERECIAQGVVCPTVYNTKDRKDNSPFAQPSWFFRPYWPAKMDYNSEVNDYISHGTLLPSVHNSLILGGTSLQGELEKSYPEQAYTYEEDKITTRLSDNMSVTGHNNTDNFYYIDQSICTLNSPDIEFNQSLRIDGAKFRIVGIVNICDFYGNMDILTSTSTNSYYHEPTIKAYGFYHKSIYGQGSYGLRVLSNGPYWVDVPYRWEEDSGDIVYKTSRAGFEFITYPWQSTGSLGGGSIHGVNINQNSVLQTKTISNLRYSNSTKYWSTANYNKLSTVYKTTDIKLITDSVDTVRLKVSEAFHVNDDIVYYSNIHKILATPPTDYTAANLLNNAEWDIIVAKELYEGDNITVDGTTPRIVSTPTDKINKYDRLSNKYRYTSSHDTWERNMTCSRKYTATDISYKSTPHAVIALSGEATSLNTFDETLVILPSLRYNFSDGVISKLAKIPDAEPSNTNTHDYNKTYNIKSKSESLLHYENYLKLYNKDYWYNNSNKYQNILQRFIDVSVNGPSNPSETDAQPRIAGTSIEALKHGILLIGELYRDSQDILNKFGGTSDYAIQQNTWIPAGEAVNIPQEGSVTVEWTEGDTYFQRYDCLKTYPYSNESENNIVEILSFMCETRVNIDGRYDTLRGMKDNTMVTNENFNLINYVYTQKDNFFTYRILDSDRFRTTHFKNQITWTKVKQDNALLDNWLNLTLANTLNLDGDKGELTSLNLYKNDIVAFQTKAISQILYNENVQISSTNGIPIEIANSGKVQGKRYLFTNVGCQNKWSICNDGDNNLYFIDNYSEGIYNLSSQGLTCLTDTCGLRGWMHKNNVTTPWIPFKTSDNVFEKNNFRTFYDSVNKDIYFVKDNIALVYSTLLNQFVSFMDYQGTDAMFNLQNKFYSIYQNNMYQMFEGSYNNIYDNDVEYYITFTENQFPTVNKIFTNLEYRGDNYKEGILQSDKTFDTLEVSNEYQTTGEVDLSSTLDPMNQIKKFRVWRLQIPRDKTHKFDRISNTWAEITLKHKNQDDHNKQILYDTIVGYYF